MQTMSTPLNMLPTTQTHTTGERRRQVIARLLGANTFETIKWRQLLQDGVLVRLRICRCRFSTRLLLEDMGIQIADETVREKLSTWLVLFWGRVRREQPPYSEMGLGTQSLRDQRIDGLLDPVVKKSIGIL